MHARLRLAGGGEQALLLGGLEVARLLRREELALATPRLDLFLLVGGLRRATELLTGEALLLFLLLAALLFRMTEARLLEHLRACFGVGLIRRAPTLFQLGGGALLLETLCLLALRGETFLLKTLRFRALRLEAFLLETLRFRSEAFLFKALRFCSEALLFKTLSFRAFRSDTFRFRALSSQPHML